MRYLEFILAFSFIALGNWALACTCLYEQNGQQAAQGKNVIVAKVKTLKISEELVGELKIERVLKGQYNKKTIRVQGGDGGNCHGPILENRKNPWIVIIEKNEEGYGVATCADSSFEINPRTKKIMYSFGYEMDSVLLTQNEFEKLLNLKIIPTIHGLRCTVEVTRYFQSANQPNEYHPLNFEYYETFYSSDNNRIIEEIDLSDEATGAKKLRLDARMNKLSQYRYQVDTKMQEPFFSKHVEASNIVDIRERYAIETPYIYTYTDLEGNPVEYNPSQNQFSHGTLAYCSLLAGPPLNPVREKGTVMGH